MGFPSHSSCRTRSRATWHVQLGIFWIATAWLAAGLFIGPAVSGVEPKWQRLGVNVLFAALLLVVVGSMIGEWLSVKQMLGTGAAWFYFGHSGYEYIDLGRLWQIALLAGLFLWLALMVRAILPALRQPGDQRPLLVMFLISSAAIAMFYMAALGYGQRTNLAIADYWRWWVVHLWVEGFFEVFATVVIAFLFARLKLVAMRTAAQASVLSATIFLSGGIVGTLHHLYFSGTADRRDRAGLCLQRARGGAVVVCGLRSVGEPSNVAKPAAWCAGSRSACIYFFMHRVAFVERCFRMPDSFGFMMRIHSDRSVYTCSRLNTLRAGACAAILSFGVYWGAGIGARCSVALNARSSPLSDVARAACVWFGLLRRRTLVPSADGDVQPVAGGLESRRRGPSGRNIGSLRMHAVPEFHPDGSRLRRSCLAALSVASTRSRRPARWRWPSSSIRIAYWSGSTASAQRLHVGAPGIG